MSKTTNRAAKRLPVTLVTGFLGSGKTTLINAALKSPELSRTVVIVNEFGEVGLDHSLVANSNDAVVVLENGCLCCTVRSDLVTTLNELHRARLGGNIPPFDNVVIETSGLAEPGPVLQAFLSEPTLDGLYRVASVLTVVDAINWEGTAAEHDEAVRQVAFADQVLISKLDMVDGDSAEAEARLKSDIRAINPTTRIDRLDWSSKSIVAMLSSSGFDASDPTADPLHWLALSQYEKAAREEEEHVHDEDCDHDHGHHYHGPGAHLKNKGVESFVLLREEPLSRAELQFLLDGIAQNLGPGMLRVKGLVNVLEEPGRPAVIQGAQHLLHNMTWLDRWPDKDERTRIVFITQGITRDSLKDVIELLDRMSARTFKARQKARERDANKAAG